MGSEVLGLMWKILDCNMIFGLIITKELGWPGMVMPLAPCNVMYGPGCSEKKDNVVCCWFSKLPIID